MSPASLTLRIPTLHGGGLVATTMTATTCRGCGARVTLTARVCLVCKAPDPTIGRVRPVGLTRGGSKPSPLWLMGVAVLIAGTALIALASLLWW